MTKQHKNDFGYAHSSDSRLRVTQFQSDIPQVGSPERSFRTSDTSTYAVNLSAPSDELRQLAIALIEKSDARQGMSEDEWINSLATSMSKIID